MRRHDDLPYSAPPSHSPPRPQLGVKQHSLAPTSLDCGLFGCVFINPIRQEAAGVDLKLPSHSQDRGSTTDHLSMCPCLSRVHNHRTWLKVTPELEDVVFSKCRR
jgi:hypothetical protein